MEESGLQHSQVLCWQTGDNVAMWQVADWLWRHEAKTVDNVVYHLRSKLSPHDRNTLYSAAFWWALEEMDLKVSSGQFFTKPTSKVKTVQRQDGTTMTRRVLKGTESQRELTEKPALEWRGAESFGALFRSIWVRRCQDVLRKGVPTEMVSGEEYDQRTGKLGPVERRRAMPQLSLDAPGQPDDGQQGTVGDTIASETPTQESYLLNHDVVEQLTEDFAYVAELLRFDKKNAVADAVEELILYIKCVAYEEHLPSPSQPGEYDEQYFAALTQAVADQTIDDILKTTAVQSITLDWNEAWDFIQGRLTITGADRYKRKSLLAQWLSRLPDPPELLRGIVGRFWLREMDHWAGDCDKTALRFRVGKPLTAEVLDAIGWYLRWTVAQAHPKTRHLSPTKVQTLPLDELFKVHNASLLKPVYPTPEDFKQFATKQFDVATARRFIANIPATQVAVKNLTDPQPKRLITLLQTVGESLPGTEKETSYG